MTRLGNQDPGEHRMAGQGFPFSPLGIIYELQWKAYCNK